MDISKATQRPWGVYEDEDGTILAVRKWLDTGKSKTICVKPEGVSFEEWHHDAALIVTAVNSYEQMLQALKAGLQLISRESGFGTASRMEGTEFYGDAFAFEALATHAISLAEKGGKQS